MKTIKYYSQATVVFLAIFTFLMMTSFESEAKKIKFLNSTVVPAAEGYVKIKMDSNKNYLVKISIINLAGIERMESSELTYVVWMKTDMGKTENMGQLSSSTSFFSKQLKASLETVSPYQPIKIFITTESETNIQYPSDQVVLTTGSF